MNKKRPMRRISENERRQIVVDIAQEFPCFGAVLEAKILGNPIAEWTKNEPPQFALGVDVRGVVDYVLSRI